MTTHENRLESTANNIATWFNDMYADLVALAENTESALARSQGKRTTVTEKDLRAVRDSADIFLAKHATPEAAGVIIRPGVVGEDGDIEWWKRGDDGESTRVLFTLTPQTAGFYDFEALEWFRNVVETGMPTVTGPYVDYAGMDQYILTLTVPFRLRGTIIGAAGCDIELRELESALMPILRGLDSDAALVSRHGRVVLGNSGRFLVGNRVGDVPGATTIAVAVQELGLTLVSVPRERY